MSILLAINDFLRSDVPMTDGVRNRARRIIRHYCGSEIYGGNRPQDWEGKHCLVLVLEGGQSYTTLSNPVPNARPSIDIEIWSRDDSRESDRYEIATSLVQLFHQYQGVLNEDYYSQGIFLEGEPFESVISPAGASDTFLHQTTVSLSVEHDRSMPALNSTSFVQRTTPDDDDQEEPGIILLDSLSWSPDDDAIPISDGNAINGHAWRVGENDNLSEQIFASALPANDSYSIFIRYRYTGINPGDALLKVTQDGSTTNYTITSNGSSDTYDGASTVNGNTGWTFIGGQALTTGLVDLVIEGPTTSSDAVIIDRVALRP